MVDNTHSAAEEASHPHESVEMPQPTAAPIVLALGMTLLAAGFAMSFAFVAVGAIVLRYGLGLWIRDWLPGRGHIHEALVAPELRPQPIVVAEYSVEQLRQGMPGYRLRLPIEVHPISAGIIGGIVGGLVMPIPAILWGLLSGHGIWFPVNLLAGTALPGVGDMSVAQLEQFHLSLLLLGIGMHVVVCVVLGLLYGVLMPTLPYIPRPFAWGGLFMPILWTGASYGTMHFVNPLLQAGVDWPWFILSQFVFGVTTAAVVFALRSSRGPVVAGLLGGAVGGILMAVPALLWGYFSGRGIWYPVNLLAGMLDTGMRHVSIGELEQFRGEWFVRAVMLHAVLSLGFGLILGLMSPKLRAVPAPLSWGGMLMPLLWTATSYGLMGVVNPVLQQLVDWPWFIVSQFVFGISAAIVVVRSEKIYIPPAGSGPEPLAREIVG